MDKCVIEEGKTAYYGMINGCKDMNPKNNSLCEECWEYANKKYDDYFNVLKEKVNELAGDILKGKVNELIGDGFSCGNSKEFNIKPEDMFKIKKGLNN